MKLSEIKKHLATAEAVNFKLPDGQYVPEHFHVTEVGLVSKHFIDCGGKTRFEKVINFQLWDANDYEHRLKPQKLLNIIALSERKLGIEDLEIEVEYQSNTIGKYELAFTGTDFQLVAKHTTCLAKENCGLPSETLSSPPLKEACCAPDSKCC
ncbi:MAG: DUF6428 family protein [Ferruginibacter sp.]